MANKEEKDFKFTSSGSSTTDSEGLEITSEDEKQAEEWRQDFIKQGLLRDTKDFKPIKVGSDNDKKDDEDKKDKVTVRKKK